MNSKLKTLAVLLIGAGIGAAIAWQAAHRQAAPAVSGKPAAAPAKAERKVLYWFDPMVPDQHFDKPGKSPFMDMDLVPKYADAGESDEHVVRIDPRIVQNLGVRAARAEAGRLWRRIDTVGYVAADENRDQVVQARASGYVEKLLVRAENDPVRRGQLLAEVYSPDLLAAQEEYQLALKRGDPAWRSAARERLSLLGVPEARIQDLEKGGKPTRRVSYYAPTDAIAAKIGVEEGSAVSQGMPMFRLSNLSVVWVQAEVPEEQAAWVKPGKSVDISFPALPGKTVEGKVDYLYPDLDARTRTLKVRIRLANPGLQFRPGMYANVTLYGGASGPSVLVPTESVIVTGKRAIVILAAGEGRFRPVVVKTGIESNGKTEILEGIKAGDEVVVSGQFLIESEANLTGVLARLSPPDSGGPGQTWTGHGRITAVDAASGGLEMRHQPIPAIGWPAMTMPFDVADKAMLNGLKVGQEVDFDLAKEGEDFVVVAIRPRGGKP
jgi:Cu(I)/Ag(I) efflux system membrane fusion protein